MGTPHQTESDPQASLETSVGDLYEEPLSEQELADAANGLLGFFELLIEIDKAGSGGESNLVYESEP